MINIIKLLEAEKNIIYDILTYPHETDLEEKLLGLEQVQTEIIRECCLDR
jgi:hypothetical protein